VALVTTDVSEEFIVAIFKVRGISTVGTESAEEFFAAFYIFWLLLTLAVASN
jgi:hypothetical protein